MFIKGNNISVRALEPHDADLLYRWENNRALWAVSFTQVPFSRFVLEEFINTAHNDIYTNKQLRLMVCTGKDEKTIGIIDLFEFDPQHMRAGVGIYVDESYRNGGFAYEAIELIREYAFSVLLLKQLFAHVNVSNTASLALFQKLGFEKNGLKKSWNKTGLNTFEDVWFLQSINNVE
jgi:diamine N-acetyltransferase